MRQETPPVTHSYLTIDQARFQILPAVPGGTGSNNDNSIVDILQEIESFVTSKNELKNVHERDEKSTKGPDNILGQDLFNSVPAVPHYYTNNEEEYIHENKVPPYESDNAVTDEAVEKVKLNIDDNYVKDDQELRKGMEKQDVLSKKEQRRRFKKCHGQCVQKFCLPVGIHSVFTTCLNNCKTICEFSK